MLSRTRRLLFEGAAADARMAGSLRWRGGGMRRSQSLREREAEGEIEAPIITTADFTSQRLPLHGNDTSSIGTSLVSLVPPTIFDLFHHMAFPTSLTWTSTQKHREGSRNVQDRKVCRQNSAPSDVNCCFHVFSVVRNNTSHLPSRLDICILVNPKRVALLWQHITSRRTQLGQLNHPQTPHLHTPT
jgi:hypothetical protein